MENWCLLAGDCARPYADGFVRSHNRPREQVRLLSVTVFRSEGSVDSDARYVISSIDAFSGLTPFWVYFTRDLVPVIQFQLQRR